MIKRKYFIKIEIKPLDRKAAIDLKYVTIVTGLLEHRSLLQDSNHVYKSAIKCLIDSFPEIQLRHPDNWIITGFNPI